LDHGIDDTLVSVAGISGAEKQKSLDIALEVVALAVSGLVNKHVCGELGISEDRHSDTRLGDFVCPSRV